MNAEPGTTPMMAQYLEIRGRHPDALLFYRMGDFYELFFEDAGVAAEALGIALTHRGQHLGAEVPMCGVPVATADAYLLTLIRKGFRVAVAEQLETPEEARARAGGRALVRRDVVRLVTPGTLTEESLLDARAANLLAAVALPRGPGGAPRGPGGAIGGAIAWADISTGLLACAPCAPARLAERLARLAPREVLVPEGHEATLGPLTAEAGAQATTLARAAYDGDAARRVRDWFGVATLDGWGAFTAPEVAALAALLHYLDVTQRGARPRLDPPRREGGAAAMEMDAATRASLEVTRSSSGGRAGSLLACLDRTATAAGARLLEARLGAPSLDLAEVGARLDAVEALVARPGALRALREALRGAGDLDRALGRLALDRGGPRDLGCVRDALRVAGRVRETLLAEAVPDELALAAADLAAPEGLAGLLEAALVAQPPTLARDGGLVAPGFSAALDAARLLRDEGRGVVAGLQARYAEATGIPALRIRHNGTLGYVVEVTATHAERMRAHPGFHHRQTTGSALRFTTAELAETEARLLRAGEEALAEERRIFAALRGAALAEAPALARLAAALARVDVAAALADLAREEGWTRPRLDASRDLVVEAGRHPVVEAALRRDGAAFVANGCDLSEAPLVLLTGPNMGGKSTYLRQAALLAILAQAGSFVPARALRLGLVSRLFSRVGAQDDLGRGRSTFMVEMVETAAILHGADDRALVLLDEVGRGTSTWDGLSIAWAVLEHLHEVNRCRAIFATHYHELAGLAERLPRAANAHVAVATGDGGAGGAAGDGPPVFLHEVRAGPAGRSYGVEVARLAGLPPRALRRAQAVLRQLEKGGRGTGGIVDDLPLFAAAPEPAPAPEPSPLDLAMRAVDPDALAPREALDLIYELKRLGA